jgi:hypothetical protein
MELHRNLIYGVHEGLVRFLRLLAQLGEGLDRRMRGLVICHPSRPGVVHIFWSDIFPERQGKDRIHEEQEIRVPFWQNLLWHLTFDPLRYVGDVVQSTVPTKTAA